MKLAFVWTALSFLLFSGALSAKEKNQKIISDVAIRHEMNDISGIIRKLGPYIASEAEFVKDRNQKTLEKNLVDLTDLFKNLKAHAVIKTTGLSINQSLIVGQLQQTVQLLKIDKRSLARAKFTSALNLCVSCHTQSPGAELPKLFPDKDLEQMKISSYEKAELYFISRDYEKAMKLYDQFLLKSKKTDDDELIHKALERQLVYFVRIQKNFQLGKEQFEKYLKANIFNKKIAEEVKEWVKALSGKMLWEGFHPETVKEAEMEKFMAGFIADEEEGPIFTAANSSEVYDLNLSTILLDYYNFYPETKLGGKILYWLAALDKKLNEQSLLSVRELYLHSCMEKYSKDPMAADCYEAYLEDLESDYLSKGRREFPPAIKEHLDSLKKMINYVAPKGE